MAHVPWSSSHARDVYTRDGGAHEVDNYFGSSMEAAKSDEGRDSEGSLRRSHRETFAAAEERRDILDLDVAEVNSSG